MKLFTKWFARRFTAELAPEGTLCVIGDIHGRADLLRHLLEKIEQAHEPAMKLVFVGDMIDRGEQSAETLALIYRLQNGSSYGDVTVLKGNHEAMLLAFLEAPEQAGPIWLSNGGAYTLQSYGIRPPRAQAEPLRAARDALCRAMGQEKRDWIRALPLFVRCGNVFISHAGADPSVPLEQQTEENLIWGHPDFLIKNRRDSIWVAHGHKIVQTACAQDGRISVDTGAYATHVLSAAIVSQGACCFVTTDPERKGRPFVTGSRLRAKGEL